MPPRTIPVNAAALVATCLCVSSTIAIRSGAVVCIVCGAPIVVPLESGGGIVHSQRDGERPKGAGPVKYLRTHRRARDAGDAEAWCEGRARLMTAACWARWSAPTLGDRDAKPEKMTSAPSIATNLHVLFGTKEAS